VRVLFRTSGGIAPDKELGFGHIYRSINLAKKICGNEIFFLIEDYGNVEKLLKKNNFKRIFNLKNDLDVDLDIKETCKIIIKYSIDLVIVDKFKTKIKFLKKINQIAKVVYVSDLNKIEYPVDLVINGFVGFENKIQFNKYDSKCLLGSKYQILNEGFTKKKLQKKKYDLLVTFGGFDEKNIIDLFLDCWEQLPKKISVLMILGPGTQKSNRMNKLLKKFPRKIIVKNQTSKMFEEMGKVNFGLCAGGITTYEFARMDIPFAIICQNEHQIITAREWEKKKIGKNLGMVNKNTRKKLSKYLNNIVDGDIKTKARKVSTDDLDSKTIIDEITKLDKKN